MYLLGVTWPVLKDLQSYQHRLLAVVVLAGIVLSFLVVAFMVFALNC